MKIIKITCPLWQIVLVYILKDKNMSHASDSVLKLLYNYKKVKVFLLIERKSLLLILCLHFHCIFKCVK